MKRIKILMLAVGIVLVLASGCGNTESSSPSCSSGVNTVDLPDKENPPPLSFVAIGDDDCDCSAQRKVADSMMAWYEKYPYDFVLMLGDNIYGNGEIEDGDRRLFPDRFDKYYKALENRGVGFHAVLGNHDVKTQNGGEEIRDKSRFGILGEKGYYVFTPEVKVDGKPLISFFALNSNLLAEGQIDEEQVDWLKEFLAEDTSIWKIAFFHHPLYAPVGKHKPDIGFRNAVEGILVGGGVQITLSGHNHFYARMEPQKGIVHFTSGGGGAQSYRVRVNDITACASASHHFMYVEVYPDKIRFWAIPIEGSTVDSGAIEREEFSLLKISGDRCKSNSFEVHNSRLFQIYSELYSKLKGL